VNHSLKYKARFFRSHIHQITGAKKEMELSKSMMAQQVRVLDLIPKSSFLLVSGEQGKESSAEYNQGRGGRREERLSRGDGCSRPEVAAGAEAAPDGWSRRGGRPTEKLRWCGGGHGARWWTWWHAMAQLRGRIVRLNLVKVILEKILQATTALFSFLQIHLFPGYPSNMTCRFIFAGNGCG
jgi:hypothetical protein